MPVIIPDHVTHSQVKIEGAEPISAGFFTLNTIGMAKAYGKSESLNLKCHKDDAKYLNMALGDYGTSAFLTFGDNRKPSKIPKPKTSQ